MDSLLANYASSDEDNDEQRPQPPQIPLWEKPDKLGAKSDVGKGENLLLQSSSKRGGIIDSLPAPKSSLFNSMPPPKSQSLHNPKAEVGAVQRRDVDEREEVPKSKSSASSSLFSSLPAPKSSAPPSSANSKRVVQFRPPTMTNTYTAGVVDEDEDDEEDEEERQRKRSKASISTASASSFLSSIPAPRHSATLGALPSASGMNRRSMLETDTLPSSADSVVAVDGSEGYVADQSGEMKYDHSSWNSGCERNVHYSGYGAIPDSNLSSTPVSSISTAYDTGVNYNAGYLGDQPHEIHGHSNGLGGESFAYYGVPSGSGAEMNPQAVPYEAGDYSYEDGQNVEYPNHEGNYGDYCNNVQYENSWANATALPEPSGVVDNVLQIPGKRGKKDAPAQIVEVKQDELMKNRPREDQVKLTGIAFGPAYQPTSTKGKPTKLHKRKHQIGSLYFDMKQKEMELAERRAKGYLTKAQTQAKYGW